MNTGEIQKYIDQQFSGIRGDIQKSISGYKDIVVIQVKADMWTEYQKIIENANSGISNQITTFNVILVILWLFWARISRYINKKYNKIKKIKNIVDTKKIEIENIKEDVNKFINDQEDIIFNRVMELMTDRYLSSLDVDPKYINSLFSFLNIIDKKYINQNHYDKLKSKLNNISDSWLIDTYIIVMLYLFPVSLFEDEEVDFNKLSHINLFYSESKIKLTAIKNYYKINKTAEYTSRFILLVKKFYQENVFLWEEKNEFKDFIESIMREVWLESERNDIIKPSTIPETTTTSQAKTP